MAVIRCANALTIASSMVQELYTSTVVKLQQYCTKRTIEVGLATKSFPHTFAISGVPLPEARKSVGKLKTLFVRYVLKLVPYVNFAEQEFIQIRDRQDIIINLGTVNKLSKENVDEVEWERPTGVYNVYNDTYLAETYYDSIKEYKWINRYVRYLNYIFRKHHIPIKAIRDCTMNCDRKDLEIANRSTSSGRYKIDIKHSISFSIRFQFVVWRCSDPISYTRAVEENDDTVFSTEHWNTNSIIGSTRADPFTYRYSIEKIFMHLEKVQKMVLTLTRKASYGSSAFSFGSEVGI